VESWLQVGDVRLDAYFQRYHVEGDELSVVGELLTKPAGDIAPQSYFSQLPLGDQFEILQWHLGLSSQMAEQFDASISINVHNSLVEHEKDRNRFLEILSAATVPVLLEFTEDYPMPVVESSNHFLREIRELGHRSALDDFGTGHNGMSLLTDYDFDVVKIDRSLIANLMSSPERQKLIKLLSQFLDVLGKDRVVEGIEDQDVYRYLVEAGFTSFQGFLFHRPEPLAKLLSETSVGAES